MVIRTRRRDTEEGRGSGGGGVVDNIFARKMPPCVGSTVNDN